MYFYRLMSKTESKEKRIHNNHKDFEECFNTHRYKKGVNYVHLFLNAESCFEDFIVDNIDDLVVAKFDIPDEIVFKYGIGLGGYNLFHNRCTMKYRELVTKNSAGGTVFWVPEIAIPEFDFNYDWCVDICKPELKFYMYALPERFMTDDIYYQEIVKDGYLAGYKNEAELLDKYKRMLKFKKQLINHLKETKRININPSDLNNDSLYVYSVLVDYALKHNLIKSKTEIIVTIKDKLQDNSINITNNYIGDEKERYMVIDKNVIHTNPTFTAALDRLGFNIDRNILYSISDNNVVTDYSLVKK